MEPRIRYTRVLDLYTVLLTFKIDLYFIFTQHVQIFIIILILLLGNNTRMIQGPGLKMSIISWMSRIVGILLP